MNNTSWHVLDDDTGPNTKFMSLSDRPPGYEAQISWLCSLLDSEWIAGALVLSPAIVTAFFYFGR